MALPALARLKTSVTKGPGPAGSPKRLARQSRQRHGCRPAQAGRGPLHFTDAAPSPSVIERGALPCDRHLVGHTLWIRPVELAVARNAEPPDVERTVVIVVRPFDLAVGLAALLAGCRLDDVAGLNVVRKQALCAPGLGDGLADRLPAGGLGRVLALASAKPLTQIRQLERLTAVLTRPDRRRSRVFRCSLVDPPRHRTLLRL